MFYEEAAVRGFLAAVKGGLRGSKHHYYSPEDAAHDTLLQAYTEGIDITSGSGVKWGIRVARNLMIKNYRDIRRPAYRDDLQPQHPSGRRIPPKFKDNS